MPSAVDVIVICSISGIFFFQSFILSSATLPGYCLVVVYWSSRVPFTYFFCSSVLWQAVIKASSRITYRHFSTLYLGASVPVEDILVANGDFDAQYAVTVLTAFPPEDQVPAYLKKLEEELPHSTIAISGRNAITVAPKLSEKIMLFRTIEESVKFIDTMAQKNRN